MREARPGSRWSAGRVLRRGRYAAYIASDDWFRRREAWHSQTIARTGLEPSCAVCGSAWTLSLGDLHHRTYDRLGAELDADLVPLCRADHDALHRLWDESPAWRRLGRSQATAGIIAALRRQARGTRQ
jgi:hypothetical protein